MANLFMTIAGINGLLVVSIGAFGAHALKSTVTSESFATFQTGVLYHMVHTLALLCLSILITKFKDISIIRAEIINCKSTGKVSKIVEETEEYIIINSIDYNVKLYKFVTK